MKIYYKIMLIVTAIFLANIIFADTACTCDINNDAPAQGEAEIDGFITEWDLDATYFDNLYKAGKEWKDVTSKLYVMYNYAASKMSVLVINEPGYDNDSGFENDEFWVKKYNGTKLIDASFSDFAFTNNGWEAKFNWDVCGCYAIKVHHLQENDETSANKEVEIYIDCTLPVELSEFTATNTINGVELNWTTESETENQGFMIERKKQGYEWQEIASFLTHAELEGHGSVTHKSEYQFTDNNVQTNHTYEYRLADVDYSSNVVYHSTRTVMVEGINNGIIPKKFTVNPAFPNPFNPSTNIEYAIPKDGKVSVTIYDLTGQRVSELLNTEQIAGWHKIRWSGNSDNGIQMPAGIYLVTVNTGNSIKTMKLIFVK